MYCVIEFTDYKKEQSIEVLFCNTDKEKAIEYAFNIAEKYRIEYEYEYIIESKETTYVKAKNVIKQFQCVNILHESDAEIQELINYYKEDPFAKTDTIDFYCNGQVPTKYQFRKKDLIQTLTITEMKDLLLQLVIEDIELDHTPQIKDKFSEIIAVVIVP